jgi:RNA recognition motif-containing protein
VDVVLYIGNLSIPTTEDELRTLFMRTGDVSELTIMRDGASGESKGYGYITMSAQSEADQAVSSLNACTFKDQILEVRLAGPRVRAGTARPLFQSRESGKSARPRRGSIPELAMRTNRNVHDGEQK